MNRVTAQQAGALDQVVFRALADHDGAQTQAVATTGLLDQDPRQQATDTTETVQHDIGALAWAGALLTHYTGQFFTNELLWRAAIAFGLELHGQLAQVHRSGTQLELAHRFDQRERLVYGQLNRIGLTMTRKAVSFENRDD